MVVGETVDIEPLATLAVMINTGNGNFAAPVIYDAAPGGRSVRPPWRWPISITTATSI